MHHFIEFHRRHIRLWIASEVIFVLAMVMFAAWTTGRRTDWGLIDPAASAGRSSKSEYIQPSATPIALASFPAQADGPFGPRQRIGEFPEGVDWLNTKTSLRLSDLKGKLVLLDFWTYCCINCMHILPTLKKAEDEFGKELVVVGVHTAKFETEKDTDNIRSAILRYEIKHPVLNDSQHLLWNQLGVSSWPTLVLIDPEGYAIWANAGEITYDKLQDVLKKATAFYKRKGTLDERQVVFDLVEIAEKETPLRFPGKVITDDQGERVFISDSNHNRIVITDRDGVVQATIGSGTQGLKDGDFENAMFNHPQGMAYRDEVLWVADTENHLIRRVDLKSKSVATVAGTGKQTETAWPGLNIGAAVPKKLMRAPLSIPLGSPWDLWIHEDDLYIAMAGPHQIWKMDLKGEGIAQYAGNGREDIVDGVLLPKRTYDEGSSSFAQPSGLSSDGKSLFVADSEGSSIRAVPLDGTGRVTTIIGTASLPRNRLFTFGDVDGPKAKALLQHPLAVAYRNGEIYVADTYNNKVKVVDANTGAVRTLVGDGQPGNTDTPAKFDEPGGLWVQQDRLYIADTNNHLIRIFDLSNRQLSTLQVTGLAPPKPKLRPEDIKLPTGIRRSKVALQPIGNEVEKLQIDLEFEVADGWKLNTYADFPIVVVQPGAIEFNMKTEAKVTDNHLQFEVMLPKTSQSTLQISVGYYYCQADEQGLCLADSVILEVPLERSTSSDSKSVQLKYAIEPE